MSFCFVTGSVTVVTRVVAGSLFPASLSVVLTFWAAGFVSNRVMWGGVEFAIEGGKMREVGRRKQERKI